jgi:hypothetical protein
MPTPKIWESADILVSDLTKDWNSRVLESRDEDADWVNSITQAVSGNTFRAFRKLPNRPSQVFRGWAFDSLVTRGGFNELQSVLRQEDYDRWLEKLVSDFRQCWTYKMRLSARIGKNMTFTRLS